MSVRGDTQLRKDIMEAQYMVATTYNTDLIRNFRGFNQLIIFVTLVRPGVTARTTLLA